MNGRRARPRSWSAAFANPDDTEVDNEFILALKEDGELRIFADRQVEGPFPRATWLRLLEDVGFEVEVVEGPRATHGGSRDVQDLPRDIAGAVADRVPGLAGLYLAGDWVGSEGFLVDASMASARRTTALVLKDGLLSREKTVAGSVG